jgi:hypothetical protein
VSLLGSGVDTLLRKEPCVSTKLAADSDWYDQEITLVDSAGFRLGDGVALMTRNPHTKAVDVARRTLVARNGNRFKLDRALRENFWLVGETTVGALFPLLCCEEIADVTIENLALDGNKAANQNFNGNYAGCVFCQDCSRLTFRGVTARNYNGDGVSWQVCHDVVVEDCHIHDNADLGLHPGSGSQRPVIRNNVSERNSIGIFFCWGVKYGLAERNRLDGNSTYGISIGHRDDENLIRDNEVLNSGVAGVLFRPERGEGYTAKGNRLERNQIVDSGSEDGIAIDVQGVTANNVIAGNTLRETRGPATRIGIKLGEQTGAMELTDNTIEGFATPVSDLRKSS